MILLMVWVAAAASDDGSLVLPWAQLEQGEGVVREGNALGIHGTGRSRSILLADYVPTGSYPEKDFRIWTRILHKAVTSRASLSLRLCYRFNTHVYSVDRDQPEEMRAMVGTSPERIVAVRQYSWWKETPLRIQVSLHVPAQGFIHLEPLVLGPAPPQYAFPEQLLMSDLGTLIISLVTVGIAISVRWIGTTPLGVWFSLLILLTIWASLVAVWNPFYLVLLRGVMFCGMGLGTGTGMLKSVRAPSETSKIRMANATEENKNRA